MFYKIKVNVQIYNKFYSISLIELCSLFSKMDFNIKYKLNYNNKILYKFFKIIKFYLDNQFFYNSMKSNREFHFYIWNSRVYPKFKITPKLLKYELEDFYESDWFIDEVYSKKYIKKFLKTFKCNRFLYIDFIILRLFYLLNKLQKKQNIVINLDVSNFRIINRK